VVDSARISCFLLVLVWLGLHLGSGCTPSTDDDVQDDDSATPADDDSADTEPLQEVDLVACLDDLACAYVFACGHRGATLFAPENTLVGFDKALELGMEIVEIDVRPTADEVLVVMHDSTVDRTTDGSGEVDEMTLAELQELVVVSEFDGIDDQPVPTFVEALEHLKGRALVNVDAKTSRFDLIGSDIIAADAREWVYVQVDSISEGEAMRQADPATRIMPDVESVEDMAEYADALHPELVEVPWNLSDAAVFEAATAAGARINQNALGVPDGAATTHEANGDDPCVAYQGIWERGATLVQTDAPHLLAPCLEAVNAANGYQHTAR